MSKYKFIYCNRCKDFYLNWSYDYGSDTKHCPRPSCMTDDIRYFEVDSMSEMAQIERVYKIEKIRNNESTKIK